MPWDEKISRRLKLKDLQALLAVIETGGIGRAAERLNYSQPAVSQAIANLERTIGKRLFQRGRKGIELTPYGDAMLTCSVAVFDDLRKGVEQVDFLANPTAGEVRIACTEPASALVSAIIDRLARRYPRVTFSVMLREISSLYAELETRKVEFAIAQFTDNMDQDHVHAEPLYQEPVVIVAGVHHSLAKKRRIRLADLANQAWVLPPPWSFIKAQFADAFRRMGMEPPHTTVVAPSAYLRIMLAAGGHFLTIVPAVMSKLGERQLAIKALPVALPPNRNPVGIITLKGREQSPVAQLFIQHARAVAKTVTGGEH
jgi:DNA-binding transcriptional LysR family regulator